MKIRLPLFLILAIFIVCKIPHLFYPYYWDESGIFTPGAIAMYRHGASLMPNAIDLYFSRGHPQFFYAAAAVWIAVFGHSHVAMHCFALAISLLLIIIVYEAGLKLFSLQVAVISIMLLSLNLTFFVSSSSVTPDMMIALFTFSTLYFYATRKYLPAAVSLTLLCYTKESAILLLVILGIDSLISIANKNISVKERVFRCASVFIAAMLGIFFYIVQKQVMGWYFSGVARSSHPNFDLGHTLYWYRECFNSLFHISHKYLLYLVLLFLSCTVVIKQRGVKYAFIFLPAILLYFLANVNKSYSELAAAALMLLFIGSVALSIHALASFGYYPIGQKSQKGILAQRFILLSAIVFLAYLYYFTIYDLQGRYMLTPTVILSFIAAVFAGFFISRSYPAAYHAALIIILCAGACCCVFDKGNGELSAFDGMNVQQSIVDYCQQHDLYNKTISAGSYLDVIQLRNPDCGYLQPTSKKFTNVQFGKYTPNSDYVIFENIDSNDYYNNIKTDTTFHLVFRNQIHKKWAEIYAHK